MNIDTNPTGSFEAHQDQAVKFGSPMILNIPNTPPVFTTNATATGDQCVNGILTAHGAAFTLTLPAASDLANSIRKYSSRGVVPGDSVEVNIYNYSAQLTIATTTGASFDTNSPTSVGTNASVVATLRFTNGTPGSEAYTIYL